MGKRKEGKTRRRGGKFPRPTKPASGSTRSSLLACLFVFLDPRGEISVAHERRPTPQGDRCCDDDFFSIWFCLWGGWRFHRVEFPGRRRPRRSPVRSSLPLSLLANFVSAFRRRVLSLRRARASFVPLPPRRNSLAVVCWHRISARFLLLASCSCWSVVRGYRDISVCCVCCVIRFRARDLVCTGGRGKQYRA